MGVLDQMPGPVNGAANDGSLNLCTLTGRSGADPVVPMICADQWLDELTDGQADDPIPVLVGVAGFGAAACGSVFG